LNIIFILFSSLNFIFVAIVDYVMHLTNFKYYDKTRMTASNK